MADLETPVPDGTPIGKLIAGVLYGYNLLFDTAGADAMGLVIANPAANTLLGRLKTLADALNDVSTNAKLDEVVAAIENISPGGGGGGDASAANQVTGNNTLASILAKITADPATQTTLAAVLAKLSSDPATQTTLAAVLAKLNSSVAVTGTFWQATQPVSLAAAVPITDNAGSLTVDAPVATPVFVRLSDGTAAISTLPVSLASLPALVAGSAIVGKVGVDQTTDGTTNKVNIDASLKSGTATRSTVNSGTSSVTILASNANRKGAIIANTDANALCLDLTGGAASATTRYQVKLLTDQTYEVPAGFTGAITGIWAADGSGIADVAEFT